jgi:hypothetical protein
MTDLDIKRKLMLISLRTDLLVVKIMWSKAFVAEIF